MSALGKEDPLLEVDSQPFLATSYADAMKLYKASKDEIYQFCNSNEFSISCDNTSSCLKTEMCP